jgi:hypothetical protein
LDGFARPKYIVNILTSRRFLIGLKSAVAEVGDSTDA